MRQWSWFGNGGSGVSSITFQTPFGTSPIGDLFTLTSSGTIEITGNSLTDAIDFNLALGSITNAYINTSAAIDATKIADGSVANTEFQFINTLSSNAQTQLDALVTSAASKVNRSGDTMTGKFAEAVVALIDAATIATDASLGNIFTVTLGGNRTLGAPTNPTSGQKCVWRFTQDGTGSRTITLNAAFRTGTDIPTITLTTTLNKTDYMGAIYNAATSTWDVVSFIKGF